ncbi:MAG: PIN domain-containing protein [bacterium]
MFLVDTNIWLEIILAQKKANEARRFLQKTDSTGLFITDFSIYSIGIFLLHNKNPKAFIEFLNDLLFQSGTQVVRVKIDEIQRVVKISQRFNLDFDDAYQYFAAEENDLIIISYDSDFDRTERGRKKPLEILTR